MKQAQATSARLRWPVALLLCAAALSAAPAGAARLLHFEVLHDGRVALDTYAQDDGASASVVWQYMADPRREAFGVMDWATVSYEPNDLRRATVRGNVVLRVRHGDAILAQAMLSELKLERDDVAVDEWRLPRTEVARTATIAGLAPPPPTLAEQIDTRAVIAMAVLAAGFVGALIATIVMVRRARRRMREGLRGS